MDLVDCLVACFPHLIVVVVSSDLLFSLLIDRDVTPEVVVEIANEDAMFAVKTETANKIITMLQAKRKVLMSTPE